MCIVGKMVYTYNWGTYINKYVYIVLPIEMSLIHLRTIVEPCILTENGIYMIWSHIYMHKDKTAYMHVESCIVIIEE